MTRIKEIEFTGDPNGKVAWNSPSNIALVKYWGKKGFQIPANPSVSMTLNHSVTVMEMEYSFEENSNEISLDFTFEGNKNDAFKEKMLLYLGNLPERFSYLQKFRLRISSHNTFPHSAGIASSASSMSALALCLLSMEENLFGKKKNVLNFWKEASSLAREASGSACRSVFGGYALWGSHLQVPGSDDRFAVPLTELVHPAFHDMRDAILLVSSARKQVSSRAGHSLMEGHPFAISRYEMANRNTSGMIDALKMGDMQQFIHITEQEALTLHGLMMSSSEPFILLHPNSIRLIEHIREFREDTGIPTCFTIDAGPNIHLLYPGEFKAEVKNWINDKLDRYLENKQWIDDRMGHGPVNLS